MEHFVKGLMNTESQISAIPPERYGDRFVKFISGVTKTREAAEREKAEAVANPTITEPTHLSVHAPHHSEPRSTEWVMDKAEHQAERSRQRGHSEEGIPTRELRSVRSPSAERGELGTTLPVVEEAFESSSTGGRSGRSTETNIQSPPQSRINEADIRALEPTSRDASHHRPPPTPPKDAETFNIEQRPPTPPKDNYMPQRHSGPPTPPKESRGRAKEKDLPMPPSMETIVRVN